MMPNVVVAIAIGLAIGGVLGLVGAGGAVLAVPAFLYAFGFAPVAATTASLAVVAASAGSGLITRWPRGDIRVRQGVAFWALGLAGAFAGARLALIVSDLILIVGFTVIMLSAGVAMWRRGQATPAPERLAPRRALVLLIASALAIGVMTGLFGVGGGFLVVPALILVLGMPFEAAAGTSLLVIVLSSISALLFRHDAWGQVNWAVSAMVIGGGLVGSVVAARLSGRIDQKLLQKGFAILLVVLAVGMVVESLVTSGIG